MNTITFLDSYRSAKRELRREISKIMLSHMVMQNIRDILPDWIRMEPYERIPQIIKLIPTIEINAEQFDKFVAKFSKKINRKPKVKIGDEFEASWYLLPKLNENFWIGVSLEFTTGNAEKCDITYKDVVIKEPVLTGYCKALAEKYQ